MCLLLSSDRSEGKCQPKCLSVSVYQSEAVQWPTTVPPSLPPSVVSLTLKTGHSLTHSEPEPGFPLRPLTTTGVTESQYTVILVTIINGHPTLLHIHHSYVVGSSFNSMLFFFI